MSVYNVCVRHPFERPLFSLIHSLFIEFMLQPVSEIKVIFAWFTAAYFMLTCWTSSSINLAAGWY